MIFDPMTMQFWYEIGVPVLCGAIVGVERELRGKPAGIRTCVLICLGTSLFVRMGGTVENEHSDPTRVIGQVVTGIGFLGGGVILARGEFVTGVTTASAVWMLAAIGTMVGIGQYSAAITLSFVVVAILVLLHITEQRIENFRTRRLNSKLHPPSQP